MEISRKEGQILKERWILNDKTLTLAERVYVIERAVREILEHLSKSMVVK